MATSNLTATQIVFQFLLVSGFAGVVCYWFLRPAEIHSGTLKTNLGALPYGSGNALLDDYGRAFHGIEISLPKHLPHVYIDGHRTDSIFHGPRYVFTKQSKLSLEGDFDTHFQAYAVEQYHALVLSILDPVVMAHLVDILPDYDVEIYRDRLRIISNKKVYNKPAEQEMQSLAMGLVDGLARRIDVWKQYDQEHAGRKAMMLLPDSTTKFGKRSVSSFTLLSAVLMSVLASPLLFLGYWASTKGQEGVEILYFGAFIIFPGLWATILVLRRLGWWDKLVG